MSDVEVVQAKKQKMSTAERITDKPIEGAPPPGTCAHWVHRKKRFCKMTLAKDSNYCGEHKPSIESLQAEDKDRITCPLDGKHTVYKSKLEKHLRICNARRKEDEPAYIERDVNAGEAVDELEKEDLSKLKLSELDDTEFYSVIEKVKTLHKKYIEGQIETLKEQHVSLDKELSNVDYGKEARKHLLQSSALLGILQSEEQLQRDTSFLEFGAGKGQLAFFLALELQQQQLENSQVVLIDRMSLRHKKDNKIEDKTRVHRIRADIADFCIERLELLQQTRRNVAVSKHLCGAATDLTLRCITRQPPETETGTTNVAHSTTEFVMIALCCHHRCEWRSFVGKDFFATESLTARQFTIITKMVSWAICGTGLSRERRRALEEQSLTLTDISEINAAQRLSLAERERIGFMCKRVLDYARLLFLREHGYDASLKYYVPREVTLENVCLLAKKQK